MSAVSLQRSAVLSFLAHITLFGITLLVLRQANHFVMPSPYVVSLVGPEAVTRTPGAPEPERREVVSGGEDASPKLGKIEEQYLSDRIAMLEAKKKIERIVKLRGIISLKGFRGEIKAAGTDVTAGPNKGSLTDDYSRLVAEEIRRHWIFPDTGDKSIEAIVSIRIKKNGAVQIIGMEKSSGNPLFDRSALRAITKASPVTSPPYEMEIGVRFFP